MTKITMAGPDGIPFKAWRELGETGVNVLWEAMEELKNDDAADRLDNAYGGEHDFNAGVMVCLPKVAMGVSNMGEDLYDANSTRPLAIVNTDNRIMCNAARCRWEDTFTQWISHMQKGFLRGRSMLSNVVKIDQEAMKISLQHEHGALVLFDFRAAFPSVEREFMMETLKWI